MIKKMKKRGKLQFFIFRIFFAPLEAKMMKNDKKMIKKWKKMKKMKKHEKKIKKMKNMKKNEKKKMKKTRRNLQFFIWKIAIFLGFFFIFLIIFHHFSSIPPLEAKMIKKNDTKNDKKWKKTRKIAIFYFLENFCTTGSKNDEKW